MFDSLEEAIAEAAEEVRRQTKNKTEAMTVIYERAGKFGYASPGTTGSGHSVTASLKIPGGSKLMALLHNHPGADAGDERGADLFSDGDIKQAQALGIPSVIAYGNAEPRLSMFTPGKDRTERAVSSNRSRLLSSRGTPFKYDPLTEVVVNARKMGTL